ncbi:xylulokinase [Donghicola eburneus]|nr:xylulokinase [Donghicola eburneus]
MYDKFRINIIDEQRGNARMSYLGLDLGTSGLRALLVDDQGAPIGSTERDYPLSHPHPGWSEQSPTDWIAALDSAVKELRATHPQFAALRGIGVAGQMHGATLLDADDTVLRPCILWNDSRSHAEATVLDQAPNVRRLSGNIVFPGFTAPKLEWVRTHEPEIYDRIAKVLLPAGYLNLYLTGEHVSDMSDSAGTSWLDVGERTWSGELLTTGHMRLDQMPRLVEGTEAAGTLRPELAKRWGVSARVVVAGGAGDNAAAACGIGAMNEGQGFVSLGTSGVLLAARDGYAPAPETALHTFCHAVPGRWYQMGVMLSATDSLNWFSRITGSKPADLTAELGPTTQAPSGVKFQPYLSGERTPHNDANVRGNFAGLGAATSRCDMTRAILEGVAFGLRDSFEALRSTNAHFDELIAIGGGTRSIYWLSVIATALDIPIRVPSSGEFGAALGAARLGMVAAENAEVTQVMTPPRLAEPIMPVQHLRHAYEDAYSKFRAAYAWQKEAPY